MLVKNKQGSDGALRDTHTHHFRPPSFAYGGVIPWIQIYFLSYPEIPDSCGF